MRLFRVPVHQINGPSITLRLSPENLTRAPLELGCNPLPSSITPAFTISSLNFAMVESSSSEGILPASESLVALTIAMNRIVVSPLRFGSELDQSWLYCDVEPKAAKSTDA